MSKPMPAMVALWSGVFLVLLLAACNKRSGLQIGDEAPAVTISDFQGKPVVFPGSIKNKTTLVRFWSLECEFCDKEILFALDSRYQKYRQEGFVPIAIQVGEVAADDPRLKRFSALNYPMLSDPRGLAAKRFGVIGLPTAFIFDEKGILREKIIGEAGIENYEKLLTTVLYKGGFYESQY